MRRAWIDPGDWHCTGRGRAWSFYLSTDDIVRVLSGVAANRHDELSLLQCERVKAGGEWQSLYSAKPLSALSLDGPWQYFIRSRPLHAMVPAPEPLRGVGWPSLFAVNGLVLLHHPRPVRYNAPGHRSNRDRHRASRPP